MATKRGIEPCEAVVEHTVPALGKCGKPGKLRMEFLLPWGVVLCDECLARMKEKNEH